MSRSERLLSLLLVPRRHCVAPEVRTEIVMPATVMPWGNRSLLLRDPDGSRVNVFAMPVPATP